MCVCVFIFFFSLSLSPLHENLLGYVSTGNDEPFAIVFYFFNSLGTSYLPVGWDYERVRTPSLTFFFAFKAFLLVTF